MNCIEIQSLISYSQIPYSNKGVYMRAGNIVYARQFLSRPSLLRGPYMHLHKNDRNSCKNDNPINEQKQKKQENDLNWQDPDWAVKGISNEKE